VRELEREARLADPAGPVSVSSRTSGREQLGGGREVRVAAEQRRRRDGQRARRGRPRPAAAGGASSSSAGSWARIAASRR
jgi:hypothetical protein